MWEVEVEGGGGRGWRVEGWVRVEGGGWRGHLKRCPRGEGAVGDAGWRGPSSLRVVVSERLLVDGQGAEVDGHRIVCFY